VESAGARAGELAVARPDYRAGTRIRDNRFNDVYAMGL
jgi:hypothetical protein